MGDSDSSSVDPLQVDTYTDKYDWYIGGDISAVPTLPTHTKFVNVCKHKQNDVPVTLLSDTIRKEARTAESGELLYRDGKQMYTKDAFMNTEYKINTVGFVDGIVVDAWAKRVCELSKKRVGYISALAFAACANPSMDNERRLHKLKRYFKCTGLPDKIYINQHDTGGHYRLFAVDCRTHTIRCYDGLETSEDVIKEKTTGAMDLIEGLLWEKSVTTVLGPFKRTYIPHPTWKDNCCGIIVAVLVLYDLYDLTSMEWHNTQIANNKKWYLYWRCRIAYELVSGEYAMINRTFSERLLPQYINL